MFKISVILILCTLHLLPLPATAGQELTVYCEYPPPQKVEQGNMGGLIYEQVQTLLKRVGLDTPIETVSWKRGYSEATTKANIALFPTTRTAERDDLFHWIGPIHRVEWIFYAHADNPVTINTIEDAKKVGAIGTYANDGKEMWLKSQGFPNLVSVMQNQTNLLKLYDHRIDLMVGSPTSTQRWPAIMGLDPTKLIPVYTITSVDLYLALSKTTSMDIVWKLQKEFKKMFGDGTIRSIYSKWAPFLTLPAIR